VLCLFFCLSCPRALAFYLPFYCNLPARAVLKPRKKNVSFDGFAPAVRNRIIDMRMAGALRGDMRDKCRKTESTKPSLRAVDVVRGEEVAGLGGWWGRGWGGIPAPPAQLAYLHGFLLFNAGHSRATRGPLAGHSRAARGPLIFSVQNAHAG